MSKLIFVGGATCSGKTTFCNCLSNHLENVTRYRRVQGFFDLAKKRGIEASEAYSKISPSDVDNNFIEKVLDNDILVSDVHYAIQMTRNQFVDSALESIYDQYVGTISSDLIDKLLDAGVEVYALHISCSPDMCFERAIKRFNDKQRELRSKNALDAELENVAERREWNALCENSSIKQIELCSDSATPEQLVEEFIKILEKKYVLKR